MNRNYSRNSYQEPEPRKTNFFAEHVGWSLGCGGAILLVVVILLIASIAIVPAGNVGVVTHWGAVTRTLQPGFNFVSPIADHVTQMNTQVQKWEGDMDAASSDLQTVTTKAAVNFHLDAKCATRVYQEYGTAYADKLLVPAVYNTVKTITAKHPVDALIRDRETPRSETQSALTTNMAPYCIIIDAVNMTDFNPSPEYNAAIEAKQVAQQQAEQAKQVLAKAKIDAETKVAEAQGLADAQVVQAKAQAESNDIITRSLTPLLLQYQYLAKITGVQTIFLPSGGNFILPLPTTPQ